MTRPRPGRWTPAFPLPWKASLGPEANDIPRDSAGYLAGFRGVIEPVAPAGGMLFEMRGVAVGSLLDCRPFERSPEGAHDRSYRDGTAPPSARRRLTSSERGSAWGTS